MIRGALVTAVLAIAACSSDPGPPVSASGSSVQLQRDDMPDEAWAQAALAVGQQWQESLARIGVERALIQPFRAPDKALVPYLFRVQADKDGKPLFRSTALVWEGRLINTTGPVKAGAYLRSLGFPGKPLATGHLIEILFATKAIDAAWLKPPSAHGWEAVPADALVYAGGKATLTLAGDAGKIVVTFAADGAITTAETRK